MFNLKTQININIVFGVLALFAGLFAHLALTDIYHAEGNLALEWNVLRLCAVIIGVFTLSTLITFRKVLKELHG